MSTNFVDLEINPKFESSIPMLSDERQEEFFVNQKPIKTEEKKMTISVLYDYRKKVFTTAAFCLELDLDAKKIRETAGLYGIDKSDLVHARYVLKTQSPLLRELVELGIYSFVEARNRIQEYLDDKRKWSGTTKLSMALLERTFRKYPPAYFEAELQEELNRRLSDEYIDRLADFIAAQKKDGNENAGRLLRALDKKIRVAPAAQAADTAVTSRRPSAFLKCMPPATQAVETGYEAEESEEYPNVCVPCVKPVSS